MKSFPFLALASFGALAHAAETPRHLNTYRQAYGETKGVVAVDPAKDLPRYPAVEVANAIGTWKVKPGFKLELAANEPLVRDPVAITFDENGRMFVCEMIDYSEERDRNPHLGRISVLEDKDGDGRYETSTVFADNLPWPTGLIWANGGLFVGATPDIWRFEDRDGDGKAEVREKIFTGFGSGLQRLNVQALLNSFHWGQDNRVHVQSASGNRGKIRNLKRPDLPEIELNARDFWFDPRTLEFGTEGGGAQYGMSFDDYGRKFGCSNSDHLQFWVYDDRYAARNPFFNLPAARQSIAVDGGAAEVFRISPDEPWRIIRTRWRIGGVVKGVVEGGGRVSGYFTGATGTTVYRGDAYGPDFVNNTFSGDAGGQLIHRKKIYPNGASLVGRRPDDEQNVEFAASNDTWVRVVNFANAPDGTLHVCDMYREVIEHPWSIPEEIKKHIDLNNGNDRGRIYRIVPTGTTWQRRGSVALGKATSAELVATLEHPNGWHRDTAHRLLYERQDKAASPLVAKLVRETKSPLARHHALGVLDGLGALNEDAVSVALGDADPRVRERGIVMAEKLMERSAPSAALAGKLAPLATDADARVRLQLAFTLQTALGGKGVDAAARTSLATAYTRLAERDAADSWISAALLSGSPEVPSQVLFPALTRDLASAKKSAPFVAKLIEIRAASKPADGYASLIDFVSQPGTSPLWLRALGDGLRRAGLSIEQADRGRKLSAVFTRAAATAADAKATPAARLEAIELLGVSSYAQSREALTAVLAPGQPEDVQIAAIRTLAQHPERDVTTTLLRSWPHYAPKARDAAATALIAREDRAVALLEAVAAGKVEPAALSASQVQALAQHKTAKIAALAKSALASVIPPSRAEVAAKYEPAIGLRGDAQRGKAHYLGRCMICHRAEGAGMELGPDLITVKTRGRDGLLSAILDPHKEVAPQYIAYDVTTKDGNAYTGMIARDDATSLALKIMGGAEIALPRANVKGSSSSGKSLMPEGLETGMSVQDMADLLTYIEELESAPFDWSVSFSYVGRGALPPRDAGIESANPRLAERGQAVAWCSNCTKQRPDPFAQKVVAAEILVRPHSRPPSMKNVRLGIVGLGNIGKFHTGYLLENKISRCTLTAVSDAFAPGLKPFEGKPGLKTYGKVEEMIRSGEIDALVVATPHFLHTTIGIDALENGLHVMIEKPISAHKADAERLIAVAQKYPKQVFAGMFQMRVEPRYLKIRHLIQSGELGQIVRVNWIITDWFRTEAYYASGGWRATWKGEGGGVLLNQCLHQLDMLQWLCGMPARVRGFCQLGRFHNIEVEDNITTYLEWADGGTGVFVSSTGESPGTNRFEICGTRGKLVLENNKVTFTRNDADMIEFSKTSKSGFAKPDVWNVDIPFETANNPHSILMQNFVDSILDGAPLIAPGAEGMGSVELANVLLYSSLINQTVELPMDSAAWEKKLNQLIAESKHEKKVVQNVTEDFTKSFRR